MTQEMARRHARWRLPSGVYNPIVSADGRRWRDYEKAAETPASADSRHLEDRHLDDLRAEDRGRENRRTQARAAALPNGPVNGPSNAMADSLVNGPATSLVNGLADGSSNGTSHATSNGTSNGLLSGLLNGLAKGARNGLGKGTSNAPLGGTPNGSAENPDHDAGDSRNEDSHDGSGDDIVAVTDVTEMVTDNAADVTGDPLATAAEADAADPIGETIADAAAPAPQATVQPATQPTAQAAAQPEAQYATQPAVQPEEQHASQPAVQPEAQYVAQPEVQDVAQPEAQYATQPAVQPVQPEAQPEAHADARAAVQPAVQPVLHAVTDSTAPATGQATVRAAARFEAQAGAHTATQAGTPAQAPSEPPVEAALSAQAASPQQEDGPGRAQGATREYPATRGAGGARLRDGAVADPGPDWFDGPRRPPRLETTRPYGKPGGLAEARPGTEEILAQASLVHAVSGRFPDPRGTWIRLINAEGPSEDPFRSTNAVDCALAVMSTWHGEPVVAARRHPEFDAGGKPLLTGETGGVARAEQWLGHRFEYVGHGRRAYVAIAQRLVFGGHGASAVLITRWPGGGSHAWNAVNCRDEVLWIDAQRGHMAVEPPYEAVTGVFCVVIDREGQRL
ncbi:hypothetical protein GCM10023194_65050 [Planotetraspora phitsanulokensis]|uniref:Tox-PL domain-containing protein n=2 Tax=Planotetraspora phitsanulokensis TaxID=575192 RepID=A0A8J3UGP3_9ACTN|nr:hypothetical protein Pph01_35830 [Planotetraspora phitsanulokensis]